LSSSLLEDSDGSEPAVEDALRCNLVVTAKGIPRDRAVERERERGNVLLEIQHEICWSGRRIFCDVDKFVDM